MTDFRTQKEVFASRHLGSSNDEAESMAKAIGFKSFNDLIDKTVPQTIRLKSELDLDGPLSEVDFLKSFSEMMDQNKLFKSYIGGGYYDCTVPNVILRNILENPAWYTAYTPYQAEIAQGRLEALINFQTMIIDLTGMEIANASLLDEGTAGAEAMGMFFGSRKGGKKKATVLLVDQHCFPQTISIIKGRGESIGVKVKLVDFTADTWQKEDAFAAVMQYPNNFGEVVDISETVKKAKELGLHVAVASDLMALTMLKEPGAFGADVVFGTSQRFGVPMGFGGPHAAFFACKEEFKRKMPGRIIGISQDSAGNPAYRMALQTREQHIRREKATSNICTAQVLLAVMAGMYAVYHGPNGLITIAGKIHDLARHLEAGLAGLGLKQLNQSYFDTLRFDLDGKSAKLRSLTRKHKINLRYLKNGEICISVDETKNLSDIDALIGIFAELVSKKTIASTTLTPVIKGSVKRDSDFMTHEVFNSYQTEHEMLRYMKRLESKDLSLVHSMISLGSCTMKLNATSEMIPVTWPELGGMHPFAPKYQAKGYYQMFEELESQLNEITGFAATSLQPNSGAQGEFAGLMVIRAYHRSRKDNKRNIALIPASAHGTNPASAVMAGMKVVIVNCDERGNIEVEDLRAKAEKYSDVLSALMVTYPSTHGVFEESIQEICAIIHEHGGQVYMDGANMNAQVGLTNPATIGADVCHLNLHKTFCIPHGGGGPGMGPICVVEHLAEFLPGNPLVKSGGRKGVNAISAAPFGSASILAISYAYIKMMGGNGLTEATKLAILNANYIRYRLQDAYEILYTGANGTCAHEMIIDCRAFKKIHIEVADIAKRLMDYGFHAPTVSFPVAGTMMIEPTESETKAELDRFCEAMLSIKEEIDEVAKGLYPEDNNVVVNAPHTAALITADRWELPYPRSKAAYPLDYVKHNKFWPAVGRVDNAFGDRNLVCSCLPIESYMEEVAS